MAFERIKQFINKITEGVIEHPRESWTALSIPGTRFDYNKEVGTGLGSNVIMSIVHWIMTTFVEAPIRLDKVDASGKSEQIFDHPLLSLLETPNSHYSWETLEMATMMSYSLSGNAYWIKVRNGIGQVIELWYAPHWMMTPKSDGRNVTSFIDHYIYNPNGFPVKIAPEDVVHFRFGLNPFNMRLGWNRLAPVNREVFIDDQAANYTASMLRNMGVPGVLIAPGDSDTEFENKEEIKEKFKSTFTGDNKGQAMVMSRNTKVTTFAFDPKVLEIGNTRDISEERVCATLGIPAAVVGFGSGLQQTKVGATMTALIKLAWDGNIIPSQKVIAQTIERQLLVDFDDDKSLNVSFDNSKIAALQEDKDKKVKRLSDGVVKGWAMVSDAREAEGLSVEDSDRVYLRTLAQIEVSE